MTFLDALPKAVEALSAWQDKHQAEFAEKMNQLPESDFQRDLLGHLSGGPRLAAIKGFGPEHIDALLVTAHGQIKAGLLAKARETLQLIIILDPYEDRALYTYASTLQIEGNYFMAGMFYMQYVMMKAMEPRGYLRIGECLFGDGHLEDAKEYITGALDLATEVGDELSKKQAKAALAEIEQASNAASAQKIN